jgi:hypothetical protein
MLGVALAITAIPGDGSGVASGGGGGGAPNAALFKDGSQWLVRTDSADPPDGYLTTRDGGRSFVIDPAASSGLTLIVSSGQLAVHYP